MSTNSKRRKAIVCILLISITLLGVQACDNSNVDDATNSATPVEQPSTPVRPHISQIPGFDFKALSNSLIRMGYKSTRECYPDGSGSETCEWNFDLSKGSGKYNVTAFGKNQQSIEQVEIMVNYTSGPTKESMKAFEKIASLNYTNADPTKAMQWLHSNFGNDGASTQIGDVHFKIHTKNPKLRTFFIMTIDDE